MLPHVRSGTLRAVTGSRKSLGRASSPAAERVSRDLRLGRSPALRRRRLAVGLNLLAAGALGIVSLYQAGLVRHLPEPPLPGLDADRVDASGEAYRYGLTPDALIGMASAGITAALAAAGPADRARSMPLVPLLAAAKAAADAASAVVLTGEQWSRHRAFCMYCLTAAACNIVALAAAVPEAAESIRVLRGRPDAAPARGPTGGAARPSRRRPRPSPRG
jgi:uncharacterized membrane protein